MCLWCSFAALDNNFCSLCLSCFVDDVDDVVDNAMTVSNNDFNMMVVIDGVVVVVVSDLNEFVS